MANTTASMPAMGAAASSSEASGGSWFTGEVSLDSYKEGRYSDGGVDSEGVNCRVGVVSTGGGGGGDGDGDGICGVCCGVSGLLLVTVVFWWLGDGGSSGRDCGGLGCGD